MATVEAPNVNVGGVVAAEEEEEDDTPNGIPGLVTWAEAEKLKGLLEGVRMVEEAANGLLVVGAPPSPPKILGVDTDGVG